MSVAASSPRPSEPRRTPGPRRSPPWLAATLMFVALVWGSSATGLVSSNDGSHLALGRALALRHTTILDPESDLTLRVDRAARGGRDYSDRPPGTAFLALFALIVGDRLDGPLLRASMAAGEPFVRPAADRYARTHALRARRSPPLVALQGTALALSFHTALVGLAGLCCVASLCRLQGVGEGGQALACAVLALSSLFGPYSTVLFSHGTAASSMAAYLLGLVARPGDRRGWGWTSVLAGSAGALAVASDYALLLAVVPLALVLAPRRVMGPLLLGAAPVVLAVLAYHQATFGSPLAMGYAFHANFGYARALTTTFDGSPLQGLWIQWGTGLGAGILAQAPVMLLGIWGLVRSGLGRWLYAWFGWVVLVACHHTPEGGSSVDHRYLVPILPLLAVGLGTLWQGFRSPAARAALGALLAVLGFWSAFAVWTHFWRTTAAEPFPSPAIGLVVALLSGLCLLLARGRPRALGP